MIRYEDRLPLSIKGLCVREDTIWINPRHAYNQQKKACDHELTHIKYHDFNSFDNADVIEENRHK